MIVGLLFLAWILGALGVMTIWTKAIREDPSLTPGGGAWAVIAISAAWPLVLAIVVVGIIAYGVSEL